MIICFEGIDGCGKSTQVRLLTEKLRREGRKVEIVKHPGQTEFGQEVRRLILEGVQPRSDLAHRLLFWADLAETAEAYKKNVDFLIFDRHPQFSNYAYGAGMPGFDAGLHFALVHLLEKYCPGPQKTFVIDVPVQVAFERIERRGKLTVIEKRGREYFETVRYAYLNLATMYPDVFVVDGTKDVQEVFQDVLKRLF